MKLVATSDKLLNDWHAFVAVDYPAIEACISGANGHQCLFVSDTSGWLFVGTSWDNAGPSHMTPYR